MEHLSSYSITHTTQVISMMRILENSKLEDLLDAIISLVARRGEISINEVERALPSSRDSTHDAINFLVKFDFLRLADNKYLSLTEATIPMIDETVF